jgi:hypothetical protein
MGAGAKPLDDYQLVAQFDPLYQGFERALTLGSTRPLLAHYTSIRVMESILQTSEVWFSNAMYPPRALPSISSTL